ncbi:MAG: endonuclease NucS domain-containing protein [Planctomycetaceae bacterium]
MSRYWVIAPVESKRAELFDNVWNFDRSNGVISIGWMELGDVSQMSREELQETVTSTYPEKPPQTRSLISNMLWAFYHEIKPGDIVIARRGRKTLAGVGTVTASSFYSQGKNPYLSSKDYSHSNFLSVRWHDTPQNIVYPTVVFLMPTVSELTSEQYEQVIEGKAVETVPTDADKTIEDHNEFVLEKYLEEFIVSNFQSIFKGELQIYEDTDGIGGQQYQTEIGPIDILAVSKESNSFVVIELKKGRPSDQVVGQILRYMGWIKMNLCEKGQSVRGLVICRDPDPKLSYALEMTSNIDVRYYSISFKLLDSR